jgi:protein-S-isoprenylcysteine O-methyltransferase Ste14
LKSDIPLKPPELIERPRTSWLPIALVTVVALLCLAVVAILIVMTLGYTGPILVLALLGLLFFGMFGLQYLVWGRYFERVYRDSVDPSDDASGT